jgi:biotin carboxyl carrier protein
MFEIGVGGRTRFVAVRRAGRGFDVTVDGTSVTADLAAAGSGWSLVLDGRSYEVAVDEEAGGTVVHVNGQAIPIASNGGPARFGRGKAADPGADGPRRIVAPMPGRVIKVLVKAGDVVAARQGLVVVEAMKMENELRAPAPGRVAEVKVAEGSSVEANAVLIVIGPIE